MNKGHIYFEIQADDPKRAIDFYSQVFGWKFSEIKGLPIPYWTIETGGSRGGLLERPAKTPSPQSGTNAFVCSLEVGNFDASAKKITDLGGIVALPKFAVPKTCWQGYFVEPRGIHSAFSKLILMRGTSGRDIGVLRWYRLVRAIRLWSLFTTPASDILTCNAVAEV